MADLDVNSTTYSSMTTKVDDYSVSQETLDDAKSGVFTWENQYFTKYLGYYKQIAPLKQAIDALAMWATGKGWTANGKVTDMLNRVTGWGEDSIDSIFWNLLVLKKINGDSYAEIMRDDYGNITNIKVLNPATIKHVVDKNGIILHYEELDLKSKDSKRKIEPRRILHLSNDRIGSEYHGVSIVESCQWIIDAWFEAMSDRRRILHRSTIRVIEVDSDDSTQISNLKTQYAEAINKGEVLIVPKDTVGFPNVQPLNTQDHDSWIRYLENLFYQAVGVPKIILGGSMDYTEASSKIGYLTFEQPYMTEQRLLEQDLKNQLGIEVKFVRPVSLKGDVLSSEAANTGQVGIQNNEVNATLSRNE